jgi:hypothetical protein
MPSLEVQLRREDGELLFARTIAEAMRMANQNPDIWKISWTDCITDERIRLVKTHFKYETQEFGTLETEIWAYEPIDVNGKELKEPFKEDSLLEEET